jgi:hypothetical protein
MATEMILVPKTRYERLATFDKDHQDKLSYYTTLLRDNGINYTETTPSDDATSPLALDNLSTKGATDQKTSQPKDDAHRGSTVNISEGVAHKHSPPPSQQLVEPDVSVTKNSLMHNAIKYPSPINIEDQLTAKFKLYGKRILHYMKKHGKDIVGWNDKGMLIYQGVFRPKTNIITLIEYIFKGKGDPPTGIKVFRRALKEIRTPKAFLKPFLFKPPGIPDHMKKNWTKY